jgi:hypothetical protein
MAKNAALIIRAYMAMHNRCECRNSEDCHNQQQTVTLPSPAHSVHHDRHHTSMASFDTILLYSARRSSMTFAKVYMSITGLALLILMSGCSSNTVKAGPLSPNYIAAQEALAVDNYDQAKTALAALSAESNGEFQKEAQAAAAAPDIDSMRMAFRSASDILIKDGVPAEYAVAFCPMYKGGSSWVQKKGSIVNPYTGKSMPGCGVFKN